MNAKDAKKKCSKVLIIRMYVYLKESRIQI